MIKNLYYHKYEDEHGNETCWSVQFDYNYKNYSIFNYGNISSYRKYMGFITDKNHMKYGNELFASNTWLNLEQAIRIINLQIYK